MSSVSGCGGAPALSYQSMRSQQLFSKLDANGDNSIDAAEMKSLTDFLSAKTGTTVDAGSLIKAIDSDGDGNISSTELSDNVQSLFDNLRGQLMGGTQTATSSSATSDTDDLFAKIDTDGDGSISADEFKAGMKNRPEGSSPGGLPPRDNDDGRTLVTLLNQYVSQSAGATAASTMLSAAA